MNRITLTLACLMTVVAAPLRAQVSDTLGEVRRLRDASEITAARALASSFLQAHPDDGNAHWLLAQLAYWEGDRGAAETAYRRALQLLPGLPLLAIDAGRFYAETGQTAAARDVLLDIATDETLDPGARAEAQYWLGTAAYWAGDIARARAHARAAVALQPAHSGSHALLASLAAELSPWALSTVTLSHDSQQLERVDGRLDTGWFVVPQLAVTASARSQRIETATAFAGSAGLRLDLGAARTRLTANAGVVRLHDAAMIGMAEARTRLTRGVDLRGAYERRRYDATRASIDTLLLVRTTEIAIDGTARDGAAGEVAWRRDAFPDDNVVSAAWAWLLLPIVDGVRTGYSVARSDADSSRWQIDAYAPYYTPRALVVHSALLELHLPTDRLDVRASGSYGFHATERAPVRTVDGALYHYERRPTLWQVRASLATRADRPVVLRVESQRRVTTYYRSTSLLLSLLWRPAR